MLSSRYQIRYMNRQLKLLLSPTKSHPLLAFLDLANICLMADFSVRIVDCGLATYVTEEPGEATVSVGRTGTPGYTCPQYLQWQISFQSACDVFSLGVVICELVTGVLSRIETQHQMTYIVNGRNLEEDADICVDWDDGCLQKMSSLALKCMAYSASSRPLIRDIVKG